MTEHPALNFKPPPPVSWIVRTLEAEGFETWAVGGSVRDVLAGRSSGDWDFTTRARPHDIMRIFRRTVPIGVDHGTVGVLARDGTLYEVTTFRRDVQTDGRHAQVVFSDTLEEDLSRRDFTINAMAWHPLSGELRDPFGGGQDLEEGRLRTVGDPAERFREDYLRVLRALRFAGDFNFQIEEQSWGALQESVPFLPQLSPERIREELLKSLSLKAAPRVLELYRTSGVLRVLYPEVDEGNWMETVKVVGHLPPFRSQLRLAGFLSRIPPLPRAGGGTDPGMPRLLSVLERLRLSNVLIKGTATVADGVRRPPLGEDPSMLRLWLSRVGVERVNDTLRVAGALARALEEEGIEGAMEVHLRRLRGLRSQLRTNPPLTQADLALDGKDLMRMGLKPGPQFGRILESALHAVLEVPELNKKETLEALVRELWFDSGEST
ncbi:MAG: hypothetical protein WEA09_01965 [Gemmatimonadota bacterium]